MLHRTSFDTVCDYLTDDLRNALAKTDRDKIHNVTEIRLYNGRGVSLISQDSIRFLEAYGSLVSGFSDKCVKVSKEKLKTILTRLSRYSVYSHEKELAEGCFVLENGVRAGISGTFSSGGKVTLKDISSINFRIAREVKGCADEIFRKTYGRSILICGAVNSGKTTILRDLCRSYGNITKCTLVDERNEIAAVSSGIPGNDVGLLTDIITGRTRHDGIISAVGTLSPDYIFCDEIADGEDAEAVRECVGSGVRIIATIHAETMNELYSRKYAQELLKLNAFDKAVFIRHGRMREIRSLGNGDKVTGSVSYNSMRRTVGNIQGGII